MPLSPLALSTRTRTLPPAAAAGLALLLLGSGPARAIDDFYPSFGNDGIDVRHYDLSFDVDQKAHKIAARAVIEIRAITALSSFSLDLAGLEVTSVEVDGVPARFRQRDDKLVITPRKAIAGKSRFTAAIRYRGQPRSIPDPTFEDPSGFLGLGWNTYKQSSYVVSEPVGAGTWYPVNDEPTDKASYRVAVTVAKPYTVVANGVPVAIKDLGERRRFVWRQAQPMASYLAILDIDRFILERQATASGVVVRNYFTDDTPAATKRAIAKTGAMLDFIQQTVGPYPFEGYGSVMIRDPELYYALETQAMSTFQKDRVDDATVVHEAAHQWFGNAVTVAQWRDLWLGEGFATYFEYLWEHRGDRSGLEAAMADLYAYVVEEEVGPAVVSRPTDIFADNTYYRGALTLHALRLEVGDRRFFQILREYYRTFRNRNVTSADFVDVAARIGATDTVRPLLKAWLYEEPVPALPGLAAAMAKRSAETASPAERPKLGIGVRHRSPLGAGTAAGTP